MQRDVAEAQQNVFEENQARQRLQMEMDAKDSEIEQLRQKLAYVNMEGASICSGSIEDSISDENSSGLCLEITCVCVNPPLYEQQFTSFLCRRLHKSRSVLRFGMIYFCFTSNKSGHRVNKLS